MICSKCGEDKSEKSFIKGDVCAKCEYEEKSKRFLDKRKFRCRICDRECTGSRRTYCSEECSLIGISTQKREYWTNHIPSL
jgi:hypothetical protein